MGRRRRPSRSKDGEAIPTDAPRAFTQFRLVSTVRSAASFAGIKSCNRQIEVNRTRRFFRCLVLLAVACQLIILLPCAKPVLISGPPPLFPYLSHPARPLVGFGVCCGRRRR
jgi:hypothetical protein